MSDTLFAAIRSPLAAFLIAAAGLSTASAQSVANSDDQWRPAGVVRPANVHPAAQSTPAPANQTWRLPNGQQSADAIPSADDASNPLRKKEKPKQKPAANPAEPRSFQAPANAKKMASNQSAATNNAKQPAQQRSAAAPTAKPAVAANSTANQAYAQSMPQPANRMMAQQVPSYQRPPQSNMQRPNNNGQNGSLWDSITVAFQGDAPASKRTSETLPPPGEKSVTLPDPVMKHFDGPGAFIGPYQPPYGEPGGCCDGSCNGPCNGGCPCGDCCPGPQCVCGCQCGGPCCDQGCGCEPGCGEPSCGCNNGCDRGEFCIGPGDDESCHVVRIRWPKWQEVEVFAGVQGFKDPYSGFPVRDSGNFGFNEGFNIGAKVPYCALGYQFGYRTTQDELSGDATSGNTNSFLQQFATAGLFHRQCEGLNFGAVWDVLSDERFVTKHYNQIRTELSIRDGGCHEIGAQAIVGLNDHSFLDNSLNATPGSTDPTFQASDQYLLFYRYHGSCGGEGRFFAGVNNNSDGLLGADMNIPIGERFSVRSGFEYLIPHENNGVQGASQEAWNISLGLVWHWDGQAHKCFDNCYRPLFDVADNGSLIVDQQ